MFHVPAHKSASAGSVSNLKLAPGRYVRIADHYVNLDHQWLGLLESIANDPRQAEQARLEAMEMIAELRA